MVGEARMEEVTTPEATETVLGIPEKRAVMNLPPKKILILGTCPSRLAAPIGDISWDVWTIGPGGKNSNRWNVLFEIHGNQTWPEGFAEYLHELKQEKPPKRIYTEEPMPDWPANVVFPKDQLYQKYGRKWFTSSISYALALALEENVTDLGIFGIDLESGEEYKGQYDGARYFLDLARLCGVNIILPKGCGLLRDPLPYPNSYESHISQTIDSKIAYLSQIAAQLRDQHGQIAAQVNRVEGEIGAFQFMRQLYVIGGESADRRIEVTQKPSLEAKVDMLIGMLGKHPGDALKKLT